MYSLTWEHGRQLKTAFVDGDDRCDLSFSYDADGIRTAKTANGTSHRYLTQGGKVVRETIGTGATAEVLDFIYDESGKPFSLVYKNGTADAKTYYYVLNLQGDVVKLVEHVYDDDAEEYVLSTVASYTYNAWGEILTATGTMADINPLRYRGYYYDTETGWYYLQSRYYDPVLHRFINADSFASTGAGILGCNMFAYCNNNPIAYSDSSGQIIELSANATEQQKEQYEHAVAHIRKSKVGRALIAKLENAEEVITIEFIETNTGTFYQPSNRTIYFNIYLGGAMSDGISVQSPALVLAHEMGHAAQHLDGQLDVFFSDKTKRSVVENQNLQMYETPIAKQLREPYRSDYDDNLGFTSMKNSTNFIVKIKRPWWSYLLVSVLVFPIKYIEYPGID